MSNIAIITGAATGIGLATSAKLIDLGYSIAALDNNVENLETARAKIADDRFIPFNVDVRDFNAFNACVNEVANSHFVSALVNNVGGNTEKISVEEIDSTYFARTITDNLTTAFNGTAIVAPIMKKQRYGRIVNLSSIAGRTRTLFTNAAYVAAKAGVIGLTKQAAAELAPYGVAVNSVAHGPIMTQRIAAAWEMKDEQERDRIISAIPSGRLGNIDEAADAVVYFCTESAGYCVGSILDVNGGLYI